MPPASHRQQPAALPCRLQYINNTGLIWEIAEGMGALIVFAEHRYEPLSHPNICGNGTANCFSFCTTAQANADWAAIIKELRKKHAIRAPAVAFGGSYGGMLSGWFRMRYGNFDIILDHFPRSFQLCNALHAPRAVIHFVPMLIVC